MPRTLPHTRCGTERRVRSRVTPVVHGSLRHRGWHRKRRLRRAEFLSPSLERMPHPSNFHQCLGTASSDRSLSQTLHEERCREARRLRGYRGRDRRLARRCTGPEVWRAQLFVQSTRKTSRPTSPGKIVNSACEIYRRRFVRCCRPTRWRPRYRQQSPPGFRSVPRLLGREAGPRAGAIPRTPCARLVAAGAAVAVAGGAKRSVRPIADPTDSGRRAPAPRCRRRR